MAKIRVATLKRIIHCIVDSQLVSTFTKVLIRRHLIDVTYLGMTPGSMNVARLKFMTTKSVTKPW